MTDPQLTDAYHQAFDDTENDAIHRMENFIHTLPTPGTQVHRTRWLLPVGVAAAVAAVAVTTITITAGSTNPAGPAGAAPAGAPAVTATSTAHPSPQRPTRPPSTRSAAPTPITQLTPSTAPDRPATGQPPRPTRPASTHSAAPTPTTPTTDLTPSTATAAPTTLKSTVSPHPSASSRPAPPAVSTAAGPGQPEATTTYPTIGEMDIPGPLAPYSKASTYTKIPAGLVVRTPADDVYQGGGDKISFIMYISPPNPDPKVVIGGYLVTVAAPSVPYHSIDGQGPSTTPAGPALHLGDRIWHWNANHTLLIFTSTNTNLYIGVLATNVHDFAPTIPTGYSTADIELIAAGIRT